MARWYHSLRQVSDIKSDLVAAHRHGDEEAMRRLSQEKEQAKKRRTCPDCDVPINDTSSHCRLHYNVRRFYARALPLISALAVLAFTNGPVAERIKAMKDASTKAQTVGQPAAPRVARAVTVAWEPTTDERPLVFYHLYYGTQSGALDSFVTTTNTSATVTDIPNGATMYFAATVAVAVGNGDWQESDKSAEVSYTVPFQPMGLTIITLTPQSSFDGGMTWRNCPLSYTNPLVATMLFRLSITKTNL